MAKYTLAEAVADYLERRGLKKAANTIRNDKMTLYPFLEMTGNVALQSINDGHVNKYLADAARRRPKSSHIDVSILKKFFAWIVEKRKVPPRWINPMDDVERPKVPEVHRLHVPRYDYPKLLNACEHPLDRATVAIGWNLMLRGSDIAKIQMEELNLHDRVLRLVPKKTGRADILPIRDGLERELRRWLAFYAQECGVPQPHWYLVPSKVGHVSERHPETGQFGYAGKPGPLRPGMKMTKPWRPAQRALEGAGYPVRDVVTGESLREGEHTLRRSGALALYEEACEDGHPDPIRLVQFMLGHKHRSQTEHYLGRRQGQVARDVWIHSRKDYDVEASKVIPLGGSEGLGALGDEARASV